MTSMVPRSSSARLRPEYPANVTSSRPECQRDAEMVSGPCAAGSVARTEPAANLRSGSSVRTCTGTSPRIPCRRADPGRQRPGGPSATADDLAQILWVHADLQHPAPPQPAGVHPDIVREFHDASDQVLKGVFEHVSLRSPTPGRRSRRPALPP